MRNYLIISLLISSNIFASDSEPDNDDDNVSHYSLNSPSSTNEISIFIDNQENLEEGTNSQTDTLSASSADSYVNLDEAEIIAYEIAHYRYIDLFKKKEQEFKNQIAELINQNTTNYFQNDLLVSQVHKRDLIDDIEKWANEEEAKLTPIAQIIDLKIVRTSCKHIFHLGCLQTELQIRKKCPSCNQEIVDANFESVNTHEDTHCSICLQDFKKNSKRLKSQDEAGPSND